MLDPQTHTKQLFIGNLSTGCTIEVSSLHYDCHEQNPELEQMPAFLEFGLDCRNMPDDMKLDVMDTRKQCAKMELAHSKHLAVHHPSTRSFRLDRGDMAKVQCIIFPLDLVWVADDEYFQTDFFMHFAMRGGIEASCEVPVGHLSLSWSVEVAEAGLQKDCQIHLEELYHWKLDLVAWSGNLYDIRWSSPKFEHLTSLKNQVNATPAQKAVISMVALDDFRPQIQDATGLPEKVDMREHIRLNAKEIPEIVERPGSHEVYGELILDAVELLRNITFCTVMLEFTFPGGKPCREQIGLPVPIVRSKWKFFDRLLCIMVVCLATGLLLYRFRARPRPAQPLSTPDGIEMS